MLTPPTIVTGTIKQDPVSLAIAVRTTVTDTAQSNLDWGVMTLGQGGYFTDYSTVETWPELWPSLIYYPDPQLSGEGALSALVTPVAPVAAGLTGTGSLGATATSG